MYVLPRFEWWGNVLSVALCVASFWLSGAGRTIGSEVFAVEPVVTDLVASDLVASDLVASDLAASEPIVTELIASDLSDLVSSISVASGQKNLTLGTSEANGTGYELAAETVSETGVNADVLQRLVHSQVVYLAETHDDLADHVAQFEIVQALAAKGEVAIALEMFQRPFQPVLEAYLAGEITEAALIAQSEYETRWGFDWEFYAPIVRYAKENQIPLVALNTPAEVTRKVAREGLASLSGDDLTYIPALESIDTANEDYKTWLRETFVAHGGANHSFDFDNFFAAQVLWDETMAEGVVQQLTTEPARQVIVLVGEGHVLRGYGIPDRVARRMPEVTQRSVRLVSADEAIAPNETDFVWLTEN